MNMANCYLEIESALEMEESLLSDQTPNSHNCRFSNKIDGAQSQHLIQNHLPKILHNKYMLIMRMSTTLTSGSRVDSYVHLPIRLWTLITFAYGIQKRPTLVRWDLLSIAEVSHLKICKSNKSVYAQRLKWRL